MKQSEVEALRKLDQLDAKTARLRREIRELPADLEKHRGEVEASRARLARLGEERKKLQREVDNLDLEMRANAEQIRKYQIQQNSAKTNEEYGALKKSIEALRQATAGLEDRALAIYESLDRLKEESEVVRRSVQEAEERLRTEEEEVRREIAALERELEGVLVERAEVQKAVSPGTLALYQRIMAKTLDRALAPVRGRVCEGCHMEISSNAISTLLAAKEIVLCKSCSRILYLEDDYRAVTSTSYSVSDKEHDETSKDGNW